MRKKKKKSADAGSTNGVYPVKSETPLSSQLGTLSTATAQGSLCQHMVRVIWKRRGFWGHRIGIQTLGLTDSVCRACVQSL